MDETISVKRTSRTICAVTGCNSSAYKDPDLSFHHFPKDNALREKWMCLIGNVENRALANQRICSKHFSEGSFKSDTHQRKTRKRLLREAFPTENLSGRKGLEESSEKSCANQVQHADLQMKETNSATDQFPSGAVSALNKALPEAAVSTNVTNEVSVFKMKQIIDEQNKLIQQHEKTIEDKKISISILQSKRTLDVKRLQEAYKRGKLQAEKYRKSLRQLKEKTRQLQKMLKKAKQSRKTDSLRIHSQVKSKLSKHLPPGTVDCILNNKVKTHWCHEDYQVALNLKTISPKSLEYVRDPNTPLYLPLPSKRSVEIKVEDLDYSPGMIREALKSLEEKAKSLKEIERVSVLMFDEMKISEHYQYHRKSDSVFGGHKYVQVALVKGLCGAKWKQVVYYDYDAPMTKDLLFNIITTIETLGYQVFAIVSDLGPCNQSLRKR